MSNFEIPENLYGREKEIAALFESFERISKGVGEILTVPGTSGVGKTALVQELETPVKEFRTMKPEKPKTTCTLKIVF